MADTFDLQDHIQALQDIENYEIPGEEDLRDDGAAGLLEAAVESIAQDSENITDTQVFNVYRGVLKNLEHVPVPVAIKTMDSILSGFQAQVDTASRVIESGDPQSIISRRLPLEMYAFLLQWFFSAAENIPKDQEHNSPVKPKRGKGGKATASGRGAKSKNTTWNWIDMIPNALGLIVKALKLKIARVWTTTGERDIFVSCLTRPAYKVAESSEQYLKDQNIKSLVFKVIGYACKHHGHTPAAQTNIMQFLQFHEHLAEPMADCLAAMANELDHTQLADEVLREIANRTFTGGSGTGQDSKGPRAFSRFLTAFAEKRPTAIYRQLSILMHQLDSDAYIIRCAMVEAIGFIIKHLSQGEDESNEREDSQAKKPVVTLYEVLLDRLLDNNSYVRVKVLQVMVKLCDDEGRYPKERLQMTNAAISALEDKGAMVRKSATSLLIKLIETHPYSTIHGGTLQRSFWEEKYAEMKPKLQEMEALVGKAVLEDKNAEDEEDEDSMDVDEDGPGTDPEGGDEDDENTRAKRRMKRRKSEKIVEAVTNEQALASMHGNELLKLRLMNSYYSDALSFINSLESSVDTMSKLLGSKSKAEALEAMEFFRTMHHYKLEKAEVGIKQMIHLVWTKDNNAPPTEDGKELKGIRARALEIYKALYFDIPDEENRTGHINRVAKNMLDLTNGATLAELTSLEEMLRTLVEDENSLDPEIAPVLWSVYASERGIPRHQRRGAIIVLGMMALAKRSVVTDRVDTMLKTGFGRHAKNDLLLARYTCVALQRLNGSAKKIKGSLDDHTLRLENTNPIFERLLEYIQRPCRAVDWFGMAEQAVNTIYALAEHPDRLCSTLIKKLTQQAFARKSAAPPTPAQDAMDTENGENNTNSPQDEDAPMPESTSQQTQMSGGAGREMQDPGDAFELAQLLFIVGHVALKQHVYLELVEKEMKRQKDVAERAEKAEAVRNSPNKKAAQQQEDLDQVVGNAEDEIGEHIHHVRENELLHSQDALLSPFGPMLVHICGSPHKYKNPILRAAATLSLSKFLCVSSQFCDQHYRLLFKILETSKNAAIRSNIAIALGDVAVSFSTIIDENSDEMYRGLSDRDLVVKKNTLMVLTHLILNGMIKVKGQLGEMAKCLEDPEPRIADLAKLFFTELATKDNAIYNNLPDVISHLSIGEHAVDEETFQSTLKYIFTFIEKEKQAESIVEKLCQRFSLAEDERQWRDIAYCLSLLPYKSERSVKKLVEGLPHYRDKLHEDIVFKRFTEILEKARSNKSANKPDTELAEFEKILQEHRTHGQEDQALEKRVKGKKAAVQRKATRRSARAKKGPTPAPIEEEEEEDMYE